MVRKNKNHELKVNLIKNHDYRVNPIKDYEYKCDKPSDASPIWKELFFDFRPSGKNQ